jgi:hypothetical protein
VGAIWLLGMQGGRFRRRKNGEELDGWFSVISVWSLGVGLDDTWHMDEFREGQGKTDIHTRSNHYRKKSETDERNNNDSGYRPKS